MIKVANHGEITANKCKRIEELENQCRIIPNEIMEQGRDPQWLLNPSSIRLMGKSFIDEAALHGENREMKQFETLYHGERYQLENLQRKPVTLAPRFPEATHRGALPSHMTKGWGPAQPSPVFSHRIVHFLALWENVANLVV